MKSTGKLIAIDMYNCVTEMLADSAAVEQMLLANGKEFAMEPHNTRIDKEDGSTEYSVGITCKQGHVIIHLYPEIGFSTVDVFTCNPKADPDGMAHAIRQYFNPDKLKVTYLDRGDFGSEADMKPRHQNKTKTIRRVRTLGSKVRKLIMKPRSM